MHPKNGGFGPVVPDRRADVGQIRQASHADISLARSVVIRAERGQKAELVGKTGKMPVLFRAVAAGNHFNGATAQFAKLGQQCDHVGAPEIVASGMRQHRNPATARDPLYGVFQVGPAVFAISGLAFDQKLLEYRWHILGMSPFHQKAGEMGAANDATGSMAFCPLQTACNAGLFQRVSHAFGTLITPLADCGQPARQRSVMRRNFQPDHMNGATVPGHGNLHARNQADIVLFRSRRSGIQPGHIIVVSQCKNAHTLYTGVRHQFFRRESAVRNNGVAVKVNEGRHGNYVQIIAK